MTIRTVSKPIPGLTGLSACVLPLLLLVFSTACSAPQRDADAVAQRMLDDSATEEARTALAREHVDEAANILTAMTRDMEPGTEEEYRRIPWLWRVSRAAGESNNDQVILDVMDVSLPTEGEPLHDWQAVVIGGGIVSGLSAAGEWPNERIEAILARRPELLSRYHRAVDLSEAMADDESVPDPTRYDALRLIAMAGWEAASPQLIRYLDADVHDELQMGAVQGLGDINAPEVDDVLLGHFDGYARYNRHLALEGLLRTDARANTLLDAVEQGSIVPDSLGSDRIQRLREHPSESVQRRARTLLPEN